MKHKSEHNHEISSPMLYSIYGEVKKAFNADESRTLNSVAVRAAFCSVMRNTAKCTFADIGSVIGKDHSTVVYSLSLIHI